MNRCLIYIYNYAQCADGHLNKITSLTPSRYDLLSTEIAMKSPEQPGNGSLEVDQGECEGEENGSVDRLSNKVKKISQKYRKFN